MVETRISFEQQDNILKHLPYSCMPSDDGKLWQDIFCKPTELAIDFESLVEKPASRVHGIQSCITI